ncbi:MAG TPA: glycoside hydrolase family 3 N-terminal domain-containing protein, partial [Niabella sp.]|nr:glycoside hydrolase family 3 N-terminal domain-containing protein [Niabella sp.]
MKKKLQSLLIIAIAFIFSAQLDAQTKDNTTRMNVFISSLMNKMTLEEKIGQMNLPSAGEFTTGTATNSDIGNNVKKGNVGGLFNIKGIEKIKAIQKISVEESRLKIPLLFGMDVIHGYETTFPIPLGISATWDMAAIEKSARIAAIEASA